MDVDGSDGDVPRPAEHNEPPSYSSDGPESEQFETNSANHVDQKEPTRQPMISPRGSNHQSQYSSSCPPHPADLFRKPFQRAQAQAQQAPPFFNLLNTINSRRGDNANNNKPRQSENSSTQNVLHQIPPSATPLSLLAHNKGAYICPRTPIRRSTPQSLKHAINEDTSSKVWERSATPRTSGAEIDLDELAVMALKENKILKVELAQSVSCISLAHNSYMRDVLRFCFAARSGAASFDLRILA
ncbi:hypothetical protein AX15_002199 [Amanita polypyramis BW_CC]|nr:hypothetical protein AX15_002199 [Amanita polypyramis BW_CC]